MKEGKVLKIASKLMKRYIEAVNKYGDKEKVKRELDITEEEFQLIRTKLEEGCVEIIRKG
jgi:5-bromo-4-chloroindolyl phosphate hydrolysis protein